MQEERGESCAFSKYFLSVSINVYYSCATIISMWHVSQGKPWSWHTPRPIGRAGPTAILAPRQLAVRCYGQPPSHPLLLLQALGPIHWDTLTAPSHPLIRPDMQIPFLNDFQNPTLLTFSHGLPSPACVAQPPNCLWPCFFEALSAPSTAASPESQSCSWRPLRLCRASQEDGRPPSCG